MNVGSILVSDLEKYMGINERSLANDENMISFEVRSDEGEREVAVLDISDEGDYYVIEFSRDIIFRDRRNQNVVEFRGVLEKGDDIIEVFVEDGAGSMEAKELLEQFSYGIEPVLA
jgi:CMP-2-keto-3-deoxyoctulosonic acid synthetase